MGIPTGVAVHTRRHQRGSASERSVHGRHRVGIELPGGQQVLQWSVITRVVLSDGLSRHRGAAEGPRARRRQAHMAPGGLRRRPLPGLTADARAIRSAAAQDRLCSATPCSPTWTPVPGACWSSFWWAASPPSASRSSCIGTGSCGCSGSARRSRSRTGNADRRARVIPRPRESRVHHARMPFVSYPYEWPFSMLKDAALLQLELNQRALGGGLALKDATPYNVQWRGARPVFIDVGSFERLRPG